MLRASAESILFTRIYSSDHPRLRNAPSAHLLEIDGVRVLLDCGWTPDFSVSYLEQLFPYLATVDCVLLSSPDILFSGALPFVLRHIRSGVPVVAPSSLTKIGTYNVLSHFMAAFGNSGEFQVRNTSGKPATIRFRLTTDDIFCSFRAVKEPYGNRTILRSLNVVNAEAARRRDAGAIGAADFDSTSEAPQYVPAETADARGAALNAGAGGDQDLAASGDGAADSVEIIAEPVGNHRVLGAHMWRLLYQSDDILYAPDFGLAPSLLLRPTPFPSRSTVALLGCADFNSASSAGTKSAARQREAQQAAQQRQAVQLSDVLRSVTDTLRRERDVLIPLTIAGRGLEFSLVLPKLLAEKGISNFKVVVAHYHIHELLSRIRTMTELLPDNVVYGDEDIFSRIVPCRSAEEVLEVESPKLVFAEGMHLDRGIATDLLEHFLASGPNLVLLTNHACAVSEHAPLQSSSSYHNRNNAARLAAHSVSGNPGGPFSYTFDQRTKMTKAELEQHYIEEENAQQQQEASFGGRRIRETRDGHDVYDNDDGDRWDDASSDGNDDGGGDGEKLPQGAQSQMLNQKPATSTTAIVTSDAAGAPHPPGLYVPDSLSSATKTLASGKTQHLVFPALEARRNAVLTMQQPYGIPLSDEEVQFLRKTAPQRVINDEAAPLDLIQAVNDAQIEARVPCKLSTVRVSLPQVLANIAIMHTALVEAFPETSALKHLLSSMFGNAQRIVPILCSAQEGRAMQQFVRSEPQLFRILLRRQLPALAQQHPPGTAASAAAANTSVENFIRLLPAGAGVPLQLATEVFSYDVLLETRFATSIQRNLSQVKESRSSGYWEIGMVNGELYDENSLRQAEDGDIVEPAAKRPRSEGSDVTRDTTSRGSSRLLLSFPQLLPHHRRSAVEAAVDGEPAGRAGNVEENPDSGETAGSTIDEVTVGSVYVGTLELHRMRDAVRAGRNHLRADIQRGLLVLGEGSSCVRKSQTGDATLSYLVCPDMFEWREALYEQFQKCL